MAVVINDTFTEASDVNLTAHTADSGGTYSKHPNFTGDITVDGANDEVYASTAALAHYLHSYISLPAEFDLTATFVWRGGGSPFGAVFRSNNASGSVGNNYYLVQYNGTKWILWQTINGLATNIGEFTQALTVGNSYVVKITCRNAAKTVYVDGVSRITSADNSITGYNRVGLRSGGQSTSSTGPHITSFVADDLAPFGNLTLPAMTNRRVWQRTIGGTSRSMTFSGTYSGAPTKLQVRVMPYGGAGSPVVDWTDTTFGSGTFSLTTTVPQGGWYQWEARMLDVGDVLMDSDIATGRWGVGILIACFGQSNMYGWGDDVFTTADDRLSLLRAGSTWENLTEPWFTSGHAGPGPGLGNALIAALNVPVGLIPHAILGAALVGVDGTVWGYRNAGNHADVTTVYGKALSYCITAGGTVEFAIWSQGATDAVNGVSASPYVSAWNTMKSWFAEDLTNGAQTKWLMTQLGRSVAAGSYDTGYDAIREAHRQLDASGDCLMVRGTCNYTIINPDGSGGVSAHYGGVDQAKSGVAWAHGILYLLGQRSTYGGPRVTRAKISNAEKTQIDVSIAHKSGTDFTPTSGIAGFVVTDSGGTKTISAAARQNATTIRLTLSTACVGATTVSYLAGKNPGGPSNVVLDNSATAYPLDAVTYTLASQPYATRRPHHWRGRGRGR